MFVLGTAGAVELVATANQVAGMIADGGGLQQLFVQYLVNPALPILQSLTLFLGLLAGVHAIAAHHGEESAALLLVKPVLLTIGVEGFLVVLKNAASMTSGGGLTL